MTAKVTLPDGSELHVTDGFWTSPSRDVTEAVNRLWYEKELDTYVNTSDPDNDMASAEVMAEYLRGRAVSVSGADVRSDLEDDLSTDF
jgi:hypothetical protein